MQTFYNEQDTILFTKDWDLDACGRAKAGGKSTDLIRVPWEGLRTSLGC